MHNIVFKPPYMLLLGTSTVEIRQIESGKLVQLLAVPGTVKVSWEKRTDDDSSCNLGLHLIMGGGSSGGSPPNQWYTLDSSMPYTLFRVLRR